MSTRWILGSLAAALFWAAFASNAIAASDIVEKVQAALYAGQTGQAHSIAQARLEEAANDNEARFEMGSVQSLQSVEYLGQALYRHQHAALFP